MSFSRRAFLSALAAWPCFASVPGQAVAKLNIGSASLTTVTDGHLVLPGDFLFRPMPQEELMTVLSAFDQSVDRLEPECNLALYRDGTNTVLFDVGSGPDFVPTAGNLTDSLDVLGISSDEVSHVVFTHAHPDHIWGLLDDFDDLVFANATYLMGRKEWDYWWNPETVETIGEARAAFAVGAKRRMEVIEDQVELFDDGQEILPGIAAVASYGHTPGHMSFELRNGSDSALVVGDAISNHHVAFARPDWEAGSDQDMAQAAVTRRRLLERLSAEQMAVVGFHLPGGGMGRVEAAGDGFRFVGKDM